MEEIALCIVHNQLNEDEAVEYAKNALLGDVEIEDSKTPIEIKPGVYCDDIKTEEQYIETCEALVKLGANRLEYSDGSYYLFMTGWEYLCNCVGWDKGGDIYHEMAENVPTALMTTRVSYKDITAAAKAIGE